MSENQKILYTQPTIEELNNLDAKLKGTMQVFKDLIVQATALNSLFTKGTPKEYLEGMKLLDEYSKRLIATEKQLIELQSKYDQLSKKITQSTIAEAKARKANAEAAAAEARAAKAVSDAERSAIATKQKLEAATRANTKATDAESSAYKRLVRDAAAAKLKLKDLEAEVLILNRDLKTGAITQDEYNRKLRVLQTEFQAASAKAKILNGDLTAINNKFRNSTGMQGMATGIVGALDKSLKSMASMYLGFHMLMRGSSELVKTNYDLSDSLYDLEVRLHGDRGATDKLFESLKQLDTRTSLGELVNTASIVAKKGVAATEIQGITKALDDYFIVAGKEAGNREEGTASIIKLISIFNDDKQVTAGRVTEIATALVKLQNSGVATGSKMIDVAERIGAIRGLTGITLPQVLGFAAAIEQLGQKSEVAGTAGMQILTKIFADVPKYARMAGKSVQDFRKTLKDDPFEALVSVAEGLVKSGDFEQISQDLEEVGVRGARVKGVLGDIAGNAEFVRKRIKEAGLAINEEGYLAEVAAGKQQTFAASVDKMKKELELAASSDKFANFLKNMTKLLTMFIKVVIAIPFGVIITGLTLWAASWAYMKGNIISATIAQAWNNKETLLGTVRNTAARLGLLGAAAASAARTAALEAETIALVETTEATVALNTATKFSALGLILGILAALIPLMSLYSDKVEKVTKKTRTLKENQEDLSEAFKKGAENAGEEASKLELLYRKATDVNTPRKEALEAIKELKAEFPSYFGQIENEIILNGKAAKSYEELRDAIVASSRVEAIKDKLKGRYSERLDRDIDQQRALDKELRDYNRLKATPTESTTTRIDGGDGKSVNVTVSNKDLIEASRKRISTLLKGVDKYKKSDRTEDDLLLKALTDQENKSAKYRADQLNKLGAFSKNGDGTGGKASSLGGDQKDYIKDLEAKRDLELAVNEKYYTVGEIGEEEYVKRILSINRNFLNAKINYLKGNNAEERKLRAQAQLELAKLEKDTADKIMEIRINSVDAWRDNELADAKERKMKGEISETQYWETYKDIQVKYRDKIQNLINLADSKMLKLDAKTKMKLYDNLQKANDEIFKEEKKLIDRRSKISQQGFDKKMNTLNKDETAFEYDKIPERNVVYMEQLAAASKRYSDELKSALETKQDQSVVLDIISRRENEINDIEEKQLANLAKAPEELQKKIEYLREIENLYRETSNIDEQTAIISNSKLNKTEKEYLLNKLIFSQNREMFDLEIKRLENDLERLKSKKDEVTEEGKKLAIQKEIANIENLIAKAKNNKQSNDNSDKENDSEKIKEQWQKTNDFIKSGLNDLGLTNFADQYDQMFEEIINKTFDWKDATIAAASAVADALTMISNTQKERTIANLEEQLKASQSQTDQELGFIDQRLEMLNALQDKTAEQFQERNALEDKARTLKEQQAQREKMIATKKAKAEQKAAAQQAIINGLLAAAMTLAQLGFVAGAIPAALAAAAGVAMAAVIMSKDPVPQYYVGTDNAREGWAMTQERGAEIITDKHDNIKSWGNNRGSQMTYLNEGDKVKTAFDTQAFKKRVSDIPQPNWGKIATEAVYMPVINIPKEKIDYDLLADKMGSKFEAVFKKYDKTSAYEDENGNLVVQKGNRLPEVRKKSKPKTTIIIQNPNVRD